MTDCDGNWREARVFLVGWLTPPPLGPRSLPRAPQAGEVVKTPNRVTVVSLSRRVLRPASAAMRLSPNARAALPIIGI
jgi:hypothetical protein